MQLQSRACLARLYSTLGGSCLARNLFSTKLAVAAAVLKPPLRLPNLATDPPKSSSLYVQQVLGHAEASSQSSCQM